MMLKTLNNPRGAGFVQIMIVTTIVAIIFSGAIAMMFPSLLIHQQSGRKSAMAQVIQNMRYCIEDSAFWGQTVLDAQNPAVLRCLEAPDGCANNSSSGNRQIRLRGVEPNSLCIPGYDPVANPAQGFTLNGSVCNAFSSSVFGNIECPYRIEFTWKAECPGGQARCMGPRETVVGAIRYNPGFGAPAVPNLGDGVGPGLAGRLTFTTVRGALTPRRPLTVYEALPETTGGGGCTAGGRRRNLNWIQADPGQYASLRAGGTLVLKRGIYDCSISAPGFLVGGFSATLRAGARPLVSGQNAYAPDAIGWVQARSGGSQRFVLAGDTTVELFQRCESTPTDPLVADRALGVPFGFHQEIYSMVHCLVSPYN